MNHSKLTVLFIIKLAKKNKLGYCPLNCRITYRNKRKEFASGLKVQPEKWDSELQMVEGEPLINSNIKIIKSKIQKTYISLELDGKDFTVVDIVRKYLYKPEQNKTYLVFYYDSYLKKLSNLIGKEIKEPTYKKFEYVGNDLKKFVKSRYGKNDIFLEDLKLQFLEDFDYYLKTKKKQKQVTINKSIQRLRKIVKVASAEGLINPDPFALYRPKRVRKEVTYLTSEELEALENYHFQLPRLELIKDLFIFCCYTGLAYREMKELRRKHIIKNYDGNLWIQIKREKTGKSLSIPILQKAQEIMNKYSGEEELIFPSYSNQKINAYLKEIASIMGFEKNLTHHVARKTFATTVLLYNDVSMEIVSELLGHSSIQITQDYYGKILQKKVGQAMVELSNKLKSDSTEKRK
ncbi:site-specific integrase [Salegentibacter salarius]|uniref:Integrase n=1 Tax=Salegentibacter salarius TaxID=435906 RepID=A0A2N0TRK2_9FLAO|nr:site-specific integrase [Salegentibacter salarius]OEY71952.1 integrase [Salegentibacter salarius]PKD17308.1 integrase [Salegentibacter salarius]SLK05529.1 Site-specific recombinase XerD [Salegentibacter salarius]